MQRGAWVGRLHAAAIAAGCAAACSGHVIGRTNAEDGDAAPSSGAARGSEGGRTGRGGAGPRASGGTNAGGFELGGAPSGSAEAGTSCSAVAVTLIGDPVAPDAAPEAPVGLYFAIDRAVARAGFDVASIRGSLERAWNGSDADVGLGAFPPAAGSDGGCDEAACLTPIISMRPSSENALGMRKGLTEATSTEPAEGGLPARSLACALEKTVEQCALEVEGQGERCFGVVVTTGASDACTYDEERLAQVAKDAIGKGIQLFTVVLTKEPLRPDLGRELALFGAAMVVDPDEDGGLGVLERALNDIVATAKNPVPAPGDPPVTAGCEWPVPPFPDGSMTNAARLRVVIGTGAAERPAYNVGSADHCGDVEEGWYTDDRTRPTRIFACPRTCAAIRADGRVTTEIGCATIPFPK